MSTVQVDDIDPSIVYSGAWQSVVSSTRQWGLGTVHTTTQTGASATITFRGTRIMMYCSLPIGISNEIVNVQLDGGQATSSTHAASTVSAGYGLVWFDSGLLADADHTLVVSNGGGPSDMPFELDRFTVIGVVLPPSQSPSPSASPLPTATTLSRTTTPAVPTFVSDSPGSLIGPGALAIPSSSLPSSSEAPPTSFSTASRSSADEAVSTVTGLQYITTTAADGSISTYIPNAPATGESRSTAAPVAAIVGGVIGGLILVFLVIMLLCLRRRRNAWRHVILDDDAEKSLNPVSRTPTGITPFRLDENRTSSSPSMTGHRDFSREMEIATAGLRYILASGSSAASPTSPSSVGHGSNEKASRFSSSSTQSSSLSGHSSRFPHADSGPYTPIGSNLSTGTVLSTLSSMYASTVPDHPPTNDTPPSYQIATNPPSTSSPLSSRP